MILDRVDYDNVAAKFMFGRFLSIKPHDMTCAKTPHKGPDHLSKEKREQAMIKAARDRRQSDIEKAKRKLAQKEANARIRQVKDHMSSKEEEGVLECPSQIKLEASDTDSAIFMGECPRRTDSQIEMMTNIVSNWRAKARWSKVSKVIRTVRSLSMISGRSEGSPGKGHSSTQNDRLSPTPTPTRERASSTGSLMVPVI